MATVTLPDGREFEVADNDPVLDYYRGEGATVTEHSDGPSLPATFDGEKYVSGVAPVDHDPVGDALSDLESEAIDAAEANAALGQATDDLTAAVESGKRERR